MVTGRQGLVSAIYGDILEFLSSMVQKGAQKVREEATLEYWSYILFQHLALRRVDWATPNKTRLTRPSCDHWLVRMDL